MNLLSQFTARLGALALLGLFAPIPAALSQSATPSPSPFSLPFKGEIKVPLGPPPPTPAENAESKRTGKAEPDPSAVRKSIDSLSEADAKHALELLRSNYVNAAGLTEDALNRATLQGLIERLGAGAAVVPASSAPAKLSPFKSEVIDNWIGYARVGSLSKENVAAFDGALAEFTTKGLTALILDLRATPPGADFELAAELIKRFTPKGKVLFSVQRPSAKQDRMFTSTQEPVFHGVIVTLVSKNNAGAAEVAAAVLRMLDHALVVGQRTSGQAAEFAELPLQGGKVLRVAVSEIKLPESMVIFPEGLKPDLPVNVSATDEAEALRIGLEKGTGSLLYAGERVRLNEAALVAGVDPALDEAEAEQNSGAVKKRTPVADVALQRAVDMITAVQVLGAKAK